MMPVSIGWMWAVVFGGRYFTVTLVRFKFSDEWLVALSIRITSSLKSHSAVEFLQPVLEDERCHPGFLVEHIGDVDCRVKCLPK